MTGLNVAPAGTANRVEESEYIGSLSILVLRIGPLGRTISIRFDAG